MKCCHCERETNNTLDCTNCWEVRHRIKRFLQSKNNRDFIKKELEEYGDG
jgi:hypothetical protein